MENTRNKKLILYGAGIRGKRLMDLMDLNNINIDKLVDSDSSLWGTKIGDHLIEKPESLKDMNDIIICVTVGAARNEIRRKIASILPQGTYDEIGYEDLILEIYKQIGICDGVSAEIIPDEKEISLIFDCASGLGLGGIEEWTKGICCKFLQEGHTNTYILSNRGDYEIPELLRNNIMYIDYDVENVYCMKNVKNIINCIGEKLPCILVTSKPNEVLLAGKLIKDLFPQYITIISGIRGASEQIYESYMGMRKCTDIYVCVSSDITCEMIKRGVEPEFVHTMICPVECPKKFAHVYTINSELPLRIGYAGRITVAQKRMDLLLDMIGELERLSVNYIFELAGEGDYVSEINKFIDENKLQNKVKLIGRIGKRDILNFWKNKDICVNIADFEGRSRSIAEAMANGAVPVVTNTSGVHDDIKDEENGFIVDVGDYKKMAECIKKLEDNRELIPRMGKQAHLELREKCSMERHYQFWKELLNWN